MKFFKLYFACNVLLFFILTIMTLCLIGTAAFSAEQPSKVLIEHEMMSANLKDIPLKEVLRQIEEQRGVWFKGNEAFFEEEVSVQFKKLPLEDGMKRILAHTDYGLVFDRKGKMVGVMIVGKNASGHTAAKDMVVSGRKTISSSANKKHMNESSAFKVTRNIPPPGGPVKATAKELENFKVIKSCPPPGGPVEVTAEEFENFKVIKNCSPPGGPVKATAKELEAFKVIKNATPPGS